MATSPPISYPGDRAAHLPQPSPPINRLGTGIVFLVVFVDLLGFGLVLPLLPVYAKHLMAGYSATLQAVLLGVLMTSFSLMQFLFSPFWGNLSDRVGRRPVLIVGLTGSTICYTLFGLACQWANLPLMFLARFGAGVMGATISTAQAYIADVTPTERRASGMAIIGAAFGLGFTFGPLLGALALHFSSSDQAALSPLPGFMGAAFSGVALLLALFLLRESLPTVRKQALDHSPQWETSGETAHNDWHLLLHARVWHELLLHRVVGLLLVAGFLMVFALSGFEATLSVTLADLWYLVGSTSGGNLSSHILWVFVLVGLIQSLTQGLFVRRLSARLRESTLSYLGLGLAVLGFLAIAGAVQGASVGLYRTWFSRDIAGRIVVAGAGVVAAGMAFVMPAVQSLLSRHTHPAEQGRVFGVANSLSAMARIVGVLLAFQLRVLTGAAPFWAAVALLGGCAILIGRAVTAAPSGTTRD